MELTGQELIDKFETLLEIFKTPGKKIKKKEMEKIAAECGYTKVRKNGEIFGDRRKFRIKLYEAYNNPIKPIKPIKSIKSTELVEISKKEKNVIRVHTIGRLVVPIELVPWKPRSQVKVTQEGNKLILEPYSEE